MEVKSAKGIAKGYNTRTELKNDNRPVYDFLKKVGALDDVLPSASPNVRRWNESAIMEAAKNYKSMGDFKFGNKGAYNAAYILGIGDKVRGLYGNVSRPIDSVYIWEAWSNVFKIGVTSSQKGLRRIEHLAKELGVKPKMVFIRRVGEGAAHPLEKRLLGKYGESFTGVEFTGKTEFRMMNYKTAGLVVMEILANAK